MTRRHLNWIAAISVLCNPMIPVRSQDPSDMPRNSHYITNRAPLVAKPYTELPLGSIRPKGWLREQLRLMKAGMTGNLDTIYEQVCGPRNGWLGGDGDGWERGPYWIDGLLPLAYLLEDDEVKAKVKPWIEWSLANQREDGFFGPVPFESEPAKERGIQKGPREDWWPKMVMLKILKQHYLATGDERVVELMKKYFRYQMSRLEETPLGHWSHWAMERGGDNMMVVYWLYNITGEEWLLDLAEILNRQTFPWTARFLEGDMLSRIQSVHCVNLAQGMKQPIIYYQRHPEERYLKAVKKALADIRRFHGQPQGLYGADEATHGRNPTQGAEFCTLIELMFSLEKMIEITGDVEFADHLEKLAFNALPTQARDDFMGKQYFQQANQVMVTDTIRNFYNDGNARICFGTLSGYPCCTTNFHQGWPKFTQHLWMATAEDGVAALLYAPSSVDMTVAEGARVRIEEETDFPFDERVTFNFSLDSEAEFAFELRIPSWSKGASIRVNDEDFSFGKDEGIVKIDRTWSDGDTVELRLPMELSFSNWYENAIAVERGPLVFALKIGEEWTEKRAENPVETGESFWEVRPTDPWNYGLLAQAFRDPASAFRVDRKEGPLAKNPWNLENAPIEIRAPARKIPHWRLYNEMAGPQPLSPQYGLGKVPVEEITLVPYGCTTLRITEFPVAY